MTTRIKYNDKDFENNPKLTILDNLEDKGFDIPYQCREGYCGACCMKITCGKVEYQIEPMAFVDDDEILPCVCKALTDIELKDIF